MLHVKAQLDKFFSHARVLRQRGNHYPKSIRAAEDESLQKASADKLRIKFQMYSSYRVWGALTTRAMSSCWRTGTKALTQNFQVLSQFVLGQGEGLEQLSQFRL